MVRKNLDFFSNFRVHNAQTIWHHSITSPMPRNIFPPITSPMPRNLLPHQNSNSSRHRVRRSRRLRSTYVGEIFIFTIVFYITIGEVSSKSVLVFNRRAVEQGVFQGVSRDSKFQQNPSSKFWKAPWKNENVGKE